MNKLSNHNETHNVYYPLLKTMVEELNKQGLSFAIEDLLTGSRKPELVCARAAISIAFRQIGHSFTTIGSILKRDYSSIIHVCKYKRKQGRDKNFDKYLDALYKVVYSEEYVMEQITWHYLEIERLRTELIESQQDKNPHTPL